MDFASRLTRAPFVFEPDRAAEVATALPGLDGAARDLVAAAGSCSPYLKALTEREAAWLPGALQGPEVAFDGVMAALREVPEEALATELRQAKRRVALLTGLCDLGGVWPLGQVTGALTDFAGLATDLALRACVAVQARRGKLTLPEGRETGGMVALAMGKMGAGELNYSSDIDLICLFDDSLYDEDGYGEARPALVRATRRMCALLSDITAEGYVFRTDLRLRPDPASTPVCLSMTAAERYYESVGRTWERAAYIKARAAAGDIAAGERFLEAMTPFVWRRHLDFAAIQDAHDMRLRIRRHKGLGGPITLPGHNMKLGRGGIREIEFFTQTRQIIAGGRDKDLRVRGTVEGLAVLARKGWVPQTAADLLTERYRSFREVEHRLQMIGDAQTHDLPNGQGGFDRLAAFMGEERAALERRLTDELTEVHALIEGFFAPEAATAAPQAPQIDESITRRWPDYPALRSDRATAIFNRLRPDILRRLGEAAKPQEALVAFDRFLAGLPAGVQLFSLFEANPQLVDLLVDICSTAPALGAYLARNSGVFDAVIGGDFFAPWPGAGALRAGLAARLEAEPDYERRLDAARRWAKEWHFRIGVHHLRGLTDAAAAGAHYADLAEAVLAALWPVVIAQFSDKHGPPPGRGAVVVGMGSLGAARLHAGSDLDLIVIYDPGEAESSDGRRPLPARTYYARLTQALVTALTAPMAEGRLYEVDMRLRPSGNQGPVATSWASFQDYQHAQAWTWEHLALTRARVVAGPDWLGQDFESFRRALLAERRDRAVIVADTAEMRARIFAAKSPSGDLEAKIGPGRMQDIELVSQAAALMARAGDGRGVDEGLAAAVHIGWLTQTERETLLRCYDLCWMLQASSRLISDAPLSAGELAEGAARFILGQTGQADRAGLTETVTRAVQEAAEVIEAAMKRRPEGEIGDEG